MPHHRTLPKLLPALAAAALLLAGRPSRADGAASAPAGFTERPATFAFAGGEAERAGVRTAIERAISGMSFVVRPFARRRLTAGNRVFETLTVAREGKDLVVTRDDSVVRSPADGSEVEWTGADGSTYRVSQRLVAGGLAQSFVGKSGERVNRLAISEDGTLRLVVVVRSPRLPEALEYTLTYHLDPGRAARLP